MATTAPKDSMKRILEWLEGDDQAEWDKQIELGEECRAEMERMARPNYRRGRGGLTPDHDPNLNRAIPHVRAMLAAMRSRNRAAALEHGRAALAVM
jgi:hypothetical protein